MDNYLAALAGGGLTGLAVAMLMQLNGPITGISGIVAGNGEDPGDLRLADIAFVIGLIAGLPLYALLSGAGPQMRLVASAPVLIPEGFLVGFPRLLW